MEEEIKMLKSLLESLRMEKFSNKEKTKMLEQIARISKSLVEKFKK